MLSKSINVLQLIDSLSVGGAERVSINYANGISQIDGFKSFLCATREEGLLKEFIDSKVGYMFMNKKSNKDINSYKNLISFIKKNKINIIHAHSSSFFTASIVKIFTGVKIVWHDHYGKSEDLISRPFFMLRFLSIFFSYVISVNDLLKNWALKTLFIKDESVKYIQNYADLKFSDRIVELPGTNKRIVLLANLREQKNHFLAIKSFEKLLLKNSTYEDWSLLLVGRDFEDDYSSQIKDYISQNNLEKNVFILGARTDTADILKSCDIGILSSDSEGLPVALLEYGLSNLPVISSNVGQCKEVLNNGKCGILVSKNDELAFSNALEKYITDIEFRNRKANEYNKFVQKNYSKDSVMSIVVDIYKSILENN